MSTIYYHDGVKIAVFNELGESHKERHIHIYHGGTDLNLTLTNPKDIIVKIRSTFNGQVADYIEKIVLGYFSQIIEAYDKIQKGNEFEVLARIPFSPRNQKNNPVVKRAKNLIKGINENINESSEAPQRLIDIEPYEDYTMCLEYSDGSIRSFDFKPIIDHYVWAKPLRRLEYFLEARLDTTIHNVVYWGDYCIELDARDLFQYSTLIR